MRARGAIVLALAFASCSPASLPLPSANMAAGVFTAGTPHVLTVVTDAVPTTGMFEGTAAHPVGGFEFEIAEALSRRFGLGGVRVITRPFGSIVGGDLGGADLALALLTPTAAREKVLDFSSPYLDVPPVVLARAGVDVPDLQSARALNWVALRSTTLEQLLDTRIDPVTPILRVTSQAEEVDALAQGRVDAALIDFPQAVALASRSAGSLHAAAKLADAEQIAAALPKGSSNGEAVSTAMRQLIANGTIESLATRWLGPAAGSQGADIPLLRSIR